MIDLTDRKFGRLTILRLAHTRGGNCIRGRTYWVCLCICGKVVTIRGDSLKRGGTISCGCCTNKDNENAKRHGMSKTPEYATWSQMKQRCLNPNVSAYKNYGERGIMVCEDWMEFEGFLKDMGHMPGPGYSIDRMDSDGNYEPDNCQWITRSENTKRSWL